MKQYNLSLITIKILSINLDKKTFNFAKKQSHNTKQTNENVTKPYL